MSKSGQDKQDASQRVRDRVRTHGNPTNATNQSRRGMTTLYTVEKTFQILDMGDQTAVQNVPSDPIQTTIGLELGWTKPSTQRGYRLSPSNKLICDVKSVANTIQRYLVMGRKT